MESTLAGTMNHEIWEDITNNIHALGIIQNITQHKLLWTISGVINTQQRSIKFCPKKSSRIRELGEKWYGPANKLRKAHSDNVKYKDCEVWVFQITLARLREVPFNGNILYRDSGP